MDRSLVPHREQSSHHGGFAQPCHDEPALADITNIPVLHADGPTALSITSR
jgi:hypothetical protein